MKGVGVVWEDMNKLGRPKNVAGSGGVIFNFGFILGILLYIAFNTFYAENTLNLIQIFALLACIILASWIGFIDDVLGWKKGGLSKKTRIIILLFVPSTHAVDVLFQGLQRGPQVPDLRLEYFVQGHPEYRHHYQHEGHPVEYPLAVAK